jgi:transcriptional regulator with XRE-family HTH domain
MEELFALAFKKNMTYELMGELSGVHPRTIARWYKGQNKPVYESFEKVKKAVKSYKPKKPKDCVIEQMLKECGVNVKFVDCK